LTVWPIERTIPTRMVQPVPAQDLLRRLLEAPEGGGLSAQLLREAELFFSSFGDAPRARWMQCERNGYGAGTQAADLHEVLGLDAPPELITAVLDSRRQYGRLLVGDVPRRWPHFFVESVDELSGWAQRIGSAVSSTITVQLEVPEGEAAPVALTFDSDVFQRVLARIALELGVALRQAGGDA